MKLITLKRAIAVEVPEYWKGTDYPMVTKKAKVVKADRVGNAHDIDSKDPSYLRVFAHLVETSAGNYFEPVGKLNERAVAILESDLGGLSTVDGWAMTVGQEVTISTTNIDAIMDAVS